MRAIDADELKTAFPCGEYIRTESVRATIDNMPTVEPERKKEKWIAHPGGKFVGFPYMHYECDQCRDFEPEERNFCPNCGADMREEGDPE